MYMNCHSSIKANIMLRLICVVIIFSLLLSGCAAQKPKVYRVGVLSGLDFVADITDGFKIRMTELGYTEGENIIYDVQKTNFDMDAYKKILNKFVDDKVDLIVAFPTEATIEAKAAIEGTDIPLVFTFALIEGMNIVDSVQQPGGNITGVRHPGPDVALKRFEILRQLAPNAKRIFVPFQKGYPIVNYQLEALRPVAEAAGITLLEAPVTNAVELEAELKAYTSANEPPIDGILIIVEPLAVMPETFTVMGKYASEHKIPLGGALMSAGDYSAVFGVNVNNIEVGRQTAPLADKVLKGTKAGTIPVVSSETFLQINYKAAQQLGLEVPVSLLEQADEVIR